MEAASAEASGSTKVVAAAGTEVRSAGSHWASVTWARRGRRGMRAYMPGYFKSLRTTFEYQN